MKRQVQRREEQPSSLVGRTVHREIQAKTREHAVKRPGLRKTLEMGQAHMAHALGPWHMDALELPQRWQDQGTQGVQRFIERLASQHDATTQGCGASQPKGGIGSSSSKKLGMAKSHQLEQSEKVMRL
jgi:hypothetical protein